MELGFITNRTSADIGMAQAIGYTNVELFFSVGDDEQFDFPEQEEFVRALADSPVTVSAVTLHNDDLPICGDPRLQALSQDRFNAAPNPGFGQIQWGPLLALLYEANYSGGVVVEPHSQMWITKRREAGLRASHRSLSQFLLD